jgi:MoaA/NifB/PqqE/SkfB family radical SAM enzyme
MRADATTAAGAARDQAEVLALCGPGAAAPAARRGDGGTDHGMKMECDGEAAARVPLPRFLQIEPVGQCNLRCRMCPIQFRVDGSPGAPPAFMPYETFCTLLEQFEGVRELHLQGLGEPLMHPRFFDMVRRAVERGIEVSTNTNLTVLSERRAEQCVASGLARIHVSIDGATAAVYERIRLRARFAKVVRNVRRLVEARERAGARNPALYLVAVVMRCNLHELPALVELAHELGAAQLSVQHLCHDYGESTLPERYRPMREFFAEQALSGEDGQNVRACFETARARAQALGMELRLPNLEPERRSNHGAGRCDWPWRGAYLSYRGEAMPCCMVSTPDRVSLGDMVRDGVDAIWHGAAYERFRRDLRSAMPPEVCRGCSLYHGTF